jgi:hypothetical protein
VNPFDVAGVAGVAMMLGAYAASQFGRLDPTRPPALLTNLAGAVLVLISMIHAFNLAAFIMETAWALVAVAGLVRLVLRRRGDRP